MGAVRARAALIRRRARPTLILPYLGYGTRERLVLRGRVLQDPVFAAASGPEARWRNLIRFWRRLESDEVAGASLRIGGVEAQTDAEGYFRAEVEGAFAEGWNELPAELLHPPGEPAAARALVPHPGARFGVISDIDDTVVYSNVERKVRMLLIAAFNNAHTRKPFKGVAAFYRALHAGVNPLFYVSKSPWNLFAPIVEYLHVQGFPEGPVLLRDFGWRAEKEHKRKAIEEILATYPALRFVLIGDSAEQDPEIYADLVHRFPSRVLAIYIRAVSARRAAAIDRLAAEVAKAGVTLVLAPQAQAAAAHAAAEGLIQASELRAVRSERVKDGLPGSSSASKPAASSGALK